ncbi:MAG: alpha/beta hydrolase fold domain-containing protein [Christensenellaceae bacterium]|nr:alpha/beta hydrolase fold domain-containing protein [Christensenellaceae bacterium]
MNIIKSVILTPVKNIMKTALSLFMPQREIGYVKYRTPKLEGVCNILFDHYAPKDCKLNVYRTLTTTAIRPVFFYVSLLEKSHQHAMRNGISRYVAKLDYVVVSITCSGNIHSSIQQCVSALAWAEKNKNRFGLDLTKVVFGGDSTGAFIALCTATLVLNKSFADFLSLKQPNIGILAETYFSGIYSPINTTKNQKQKTPIKNSTNLALFNKLKISLSNPIKLLHEHKTRINRALANAEELCPLNYFDASHPAFFIAHSDFDSKACGQSTQIMHKILEFGLPYNEFRAIKSECPHNWQLDISNSSGQSCINAFSDFLTALRKDQKSIIKKYFEI